MVGDTFQIGENIGKDESVLDGALILLYSDNVLKLDLIFQVVNYLLKGLNLRRRVEVKILEGFFGYSNDFNVVSFTMPSSARLPVGKR